MPLDSRSHTVSVRRTAVLAAALAFAGGAAPAFAEVGNAEAWDLNVSLAVIGIPALTVTPQSQTTIAAATTPTDKSDQKPSLDIGNAAVARVTTGLLISEAEYRPSVGFSAVASQGQVNHLDLKAIGLVPGVPVLSLTADLIRSKSLVAGTCPPPALAAASATALLDDIVYGNGFDAANLGVGGDGTPGTGPDDSVLLGNVVLSILGKDVPIPVNPPPNTGVDLSALGIVGATLLLNERVVEGDGTQKRSQTSNALRLTLNVAGVITGNVVVAHSSAGIDCTQ